MRKPINGTTKGRVTWVVSAIIPISRKPHPPIGVIIRSEDADLVRLPYPVRAMLKMVGNMIASKR